MMKIKLGDMTAKQLHDICSRQPNCAHCPLGYTGACEVFGIPALYEIDKEIDPSDEKEKEQELVEGVLAKYNIELAEGGESKE